MKTRLFAVVLLSAACGGGVPESSYQSESIKTACHWYAGCGAFSSEAACTTWINNLLVDVPSPYASRIASGKVVYDASRAKACLDTYAKMSCDTNLLAPNDNCSLVYQGTVKAGEVCTSGIECTPDTFCALSGTTQCSGVCAKRSALGETVAADGQCTSGLVPVDGKCQKPLGPGASCMGFQGCDPAQNLFCGSAMVCQKYSTEGETCDANLRCGGVFTCAAGHCARFLPSGASCASVSGVTPSCQLDLQCDSTSKQCAPPGGEGAACTSSSGCISTLVCAGLTGSQKCSKPATENQSCLTVPCDEATYCESLTNFCKKRIAEGQPCTDFNSCVAQSYCSAGKCQSFTCQ